MPAPTRRRRPRRRNPTTRRRPVAGQRPEYNSVLQEAQASVMSQLQPQLDTFKQDQSRADSAHNTRVQQIQGWGNWQQGNLDKAFSQTRDALNQLVSLQNGGGNAEAYAAALKAAGEGNQGAQYGDPTGALTLGRDSAASAQMGVGSTMGAFLGAMGESRNLAGVGLQQNQEVERQRYNAIGQDINDQRRDLMAQVPGLVQKTVQERTDQLFQQYLAERELGLRASDQTFQQWLARQQLDQSQQQINETGRSNRANEDINRQQLAEAAAEATAAADEAAAKAQGDAVAKANAWLTQFLTPGKGQTQFSRSNRYPYAPGTADNPETSENEATAPFQRLFDDALEGLQNYVSKSQALRILSHSPYADWRKKAKAQLSKKKRRPRGRGPARSNQPTSRWRRPGSNGPLDPGGPTLPGQ